MGLLDEFTRDKFYTQSLLQNTQHHAFLNNRKNTLLKKISKKVNTKGKKLTQSRCFPQ